MAKSLVNAIGELKKQNEGQIAEQTATRVAIETLNNKFDELINRTPTKSQQEEDRRESIKRVAPTEGGGFRDNPLLSGTLGFLGGLVSATVLSTITTAVATIGAVTAAVNGLGPSIKMLQGLGKVMGGYVSLFGRLGAMVDSIRIPSSVAARWTQFTDMFKSGGRFGDFVENLRGSRFIRVFTSVLRPIAVVLSLFDGFRNAQAELEDREGFFNRILGGGIGGFVSGTIGSFFGEFFNLIKDGIFWPIKQLLPQEWLTENADGSVSINADANLFTRILSGIEQIDFNRLITDIIQVPFDMAARAFDFVKGLIFNEGDSREAFQQYWNERGIFGAAGDVIAWAVNLAFSPINAVLREIETAFGADPSRERLTFTQRISGYVSRLFDLIWSVVPTWDDIKAAVASILPDNALGDLARTRVLGMYNEEEAAARVNEINAEISRLQGIANNADDFSRGTFEGQIAALQSELRSLGGSSVVALPSTPSVNRAAFDATLPRQGDRSDAALLAIAEFLAADRASRGAGGGGGGQVPQLVPIPIPVDRADQGRPW